MDREWTPEDEVLSGINVIARDIGNAACDCGAAYGLPMANDTVWLRMRGLIEDRCKVVIEAATRPLLDTIEDALLILEASDKNQQQAINHLRQALNAKTAQ